MRAGNLRHRVSLQAPTESVAADGTVSRTFAEDCKRWASIEALRGRERFEAQQVQPEADIRIRMRYYSSLEETWQIVHDSRTYSIVAIIDVGGRGREHEVLCVEQR